MRLRSGITMGLTFVVAAMGSAAPVAAQDACVPASGPAIVPAITGGNTAASGTQPGPAPAVAPVHCWTGASGDAVLGAQAVATGDLIITLSDMGEVVAFPSDGSEAFRVPVAAAGDESRGGLSTDGTLVYVGMPTGIVAVSVEDGSEAWKITVGAANSPGVSGGGPPVVVGATVYVVLTSSSNGRDVKRDLVALDVADGTEHWRQPLFAEFPAGPIAANTDQVTLWDGMGTVLAFDATTGDERWRTGLDVLGIIPVGPVSMDDDRVATILSGGEVVVLSAADGSKIWSRVLEPSLATTATLQGETVIVNVVTQLVALDAASGEQRWVAPIQERAAPFPYQPIPAVVDGLVILGTSDVSSNAALVAWDLETGAEVWRSTIDISGAILSPIVTGGRVYASTLDINGEGGLFAFGTPAD